MGRQQIAATILMGGLGTAVAGAAILALDDKAVDHRIGYALLALGIAIIFVGGLLWVGGRKSRSDEHPTTVTSTQGAIAATAPINVTSIGQSGGQTAGTITNVGLQPRTLQGKNVSGLIAQLSKHAGTEAQVICLALDGESKRFAVEIDAMLKAAGWRMKQLDSTLLGHQFRGVAIRCPEKRLPVALKDFGEFLAGLGFHVEAAVDIDIAEGNEILVLST